MALVVKYLPAEAGDIRDTGLIPGWENVPGGRHSNPLLYSCLENPTDRVAWQTQSIGFRRVGHDGSCLTCRHIAFELLHNFTVKMNLKRNVIKLSDFLQAWERQCYRADLCLYRQESEINE